MNLPKRFSRGRNEQVAASSTSKCDLAAERKIMNALMTIKLSNHIHQEHDAESVAFLQGLIFGKVLSVLLTPDSSSLNHSYHNTIILKTAESANDAGESASDCMLDVSCQDSEGICYSFQKTENRKCPETVSCLQPCDSQLHFLAEPPSPKPHKPETGRSECAVLHALRSISKSLPEKKKRCSSYKLKAVSKSSRMQMKPVTVMQTNPGKMRPHSVCGPDALKKSSMCRKGILSRSANAGEESIQDDLKLTKNKKVFPCKECQKTYTSISYLIEHNRKWHKEKLTVSCKICSKQFSTWTGKTLHMRMKHKVDKPHECEFCGETFSSHKEYNAHKAHAHNTQNVVCHICGKKFKFRGALRPHLDAHFGIKRYFCEECGKGFVRVTSLYAHKTIEHSKTEDKTFHCNMCNKSFSAKWVLNHHLFDRHQTGPYALSLARDGSRAESADCKTCYNLSLTSAGCSTINKCPLHSLEFMFSCNLCSASFKTPNGLKVHLKLHAGIKAFSCSSCGKRFTTREYLKVHTMQHQEPKFECDICSRKFTYKSNMQKHRTVHSTAKPFQCDVCNKTFKLKSALTTHMRGHKPEPAFTCSICGKGLTRSLHLRNHIKKMHPDSVLGT